MNHVTGIHHITAISGAPAETTGFYSGVLGLRLVKKSINQDVPDTYHLFFADSVGSPGTDLTFFPWPSMGPGRRGVGVWGEVSFAVPKGSLERWESRLCDAGIPVQPREVRFGEAVLPFEDRHGMELSLTEAEVHRDHHFVPWRESPVPEEMQIRGLASVRLILREDSPTVRFLGEAFGFEETGSDGEWRRYGTGDGLGGTRLDLRCDGAAVSGRWGVGAVHHVAFRVTDDEEQRIVRNQIASSGGIPSEVIDRFWFRSVYVREPSGALCEVATDGPGFSVDEDIDHLGERLVLPPWFEAQRERIEASLPPLES